MPIITEEVKQQVEQAIAQASEVATTAQSYLSWSDKSEIMVVIFIPKVISTLLKLLGLSIIGFGLYTILLT